MPHFVQLWVYLSASPLFGLTATLVVYLLAQAAYVRLGHAPWANPVLWSVVVIACGLLATGVDYPTYFAGAHPAVLGRRHVPWDTDLTIACGGAAVQPGDVIVGDADGLLVIPPSLVEQVVEGAIEQERQERFVAEMVAAGESVKGLYPLAGDWKARYDAWQ